VWVAVACLAAVVIEVGAVTEGFGLVGLLTSHRGTGPGGPNPNPYGELVVAVLASITYGSSDHAFPALQGAQLCALCPVVPPENTSYDPPVAGLWFYFNVTNTGSNYTYLANFTLTTSGASPELFTLVGGVLCCAPAYHEVVHGVWFTAGERFGFRAYAIATSIPDDGPTGYTLYFNATSP
jgi:hypothetical protein